jgi:enoyl-CoA hydratase/carnithine racemase
MLASWPGNKVIFVMSRRIERRDAHGIATLTLRNADQRNAMTRDMVQEFVACLDDLDGDDSVRAVVITGEGRYFCTGAALSDPARAFGGSAGSDDSSAEARDGGGILALRLFELSKPVLGAINGDAVGLGASMILPLDVRIAADQARIGFVQVRRGIAPEGCATWFLPRLVGIGRAVEWAISGRLVSAREAAEAGLLHGVHPSHELMDAAHEKARDMTQLSAPVSAAVTRRMLWQALTMDHPMQAHRMETHVVRTLARTSDAREGVSSFLEKRAPVFAERPSQLMPRFEPWWPTIPYRPGP